MSKDLLQLENMPADMTKQPASIGKMLLIGLVTAIVVGALSLIVANNVINKRIATAEHQLEDRLVLQAKGKANVLDTWAEGVEQMGNSLTRSELVRLFASEVHLNDDMRGLPPHLLDQIPYMRVMVDDFARQNGFINVALVNRLGRAYLTSSAHDLDLSGAQRSAVEQLFESGNSVFMPMRYHQGQLVMDMLKPIQMMDGDDETLNIVGALMITVPVAEKMQEILKPDALSAQGEMTRLVMQRGNQHFLISRQNVGVNLVEKRLNPLAEGFAEQTSLEGAEAVYAAVSNVPSLPWLSVVQEVSLARGLGDVQAYTSSVQGLALLFTLAVVGLVMAGIWHHLESKHRAMANQYHSLAVKINSQRDLLEGINDSVIEMISVKGKDGLFVYANPSFLKFWKEDEHANVEGLNESDVFGTHARLMAQGDDEARRKGTHHMGTVEVPKNGELHYLEGVKVALHDEDDADGDGGIVTVARDVTEVVQSRLAVEQATEKTMEALVRTIEVRDPHLAGHYGKVRKLAVKVADALEYADEERMTLGFAARLAGVGKVFVPKEILTKPGKLTKKEQEEVQSHINHAMRILEGMDFGMPVGEVIYQMYERMDGSGYPNGLKGSNIHHLARVLGVCDVFCALVAPRSYRNAKTIDQALEILKEENKKYDPKIIRALEYLLAPDGDPETRKLFDYSEKQDA